MNFIVYGSGLPKLVFALNFLRAMVQVHAAGLLPVVDVVVRVSKQAGCKHLCCDS